MLYFEKVVDVIGLLISLIKVVVFGLELSRDLLIDCSLSQLYFKVLDLLFQDNVLVLNHIEVVLQSGYLLLCLYLSVLNLCRERG